MMNRLLNIYSEMAIRQLELKHNGACARIVAKKR